MALIVDEKGFPVISRVYEGNVSEPKTLQEVIQDLKTRSECFIQSKSPVFIMDRGIATADNIAFLESKEYNYIVIERRPTASEYESEFANLKDMLSTPNSNQHITEAGWVKISRRDDVYVKSVVSDHVTNTLALSLSRESKELAIDKQKEARFVECVEKLKKPVEAGNIVHIKNKRKNWSAQREI